MGQTCVDPGRPDRGRRRIFRQPIRNAVHQFDFRLAGILGINLPSGGPAYPWPHRACVSRQRSPRRSQSRLVRSTAIRRRPARGDLQQRDPSGTTFRLSGNRLYIGELAQNFDLGTDEHALPGTLKLGGWYHTGVFSDQRYDTSGVSLASPFSSGVPARHRGDFGGYAVVDQVLWRPTGTSDRGLSAFVRLGGSPANRNLVEFHADAGLSYTGLIPGREADSVGIGAAYERIGESQQNLGRDRRAFSGAGGPVPDFESRVGDLLPGTDCTVVDGSARCPGDFSPGGARRRSVRVALRRRQGQCARARDQNRDHLLAACLRPETQPSPAFGSAGRQENRRLPWSGSEAKWPALSRHEDAVLKISGKHYRTIRPREDGGVEIIDQTKLPHRFETVTLATRRRGGACHRGDGGARCAIDRRHGGLRHGAGDAGRCLRCGPRPRP